MDTNHEELCSIPWLQPNCKELSLKVCFFALSEQWIPVAEEPEQTYLRNSFEQMRQKNRYTYYVTLYHLLSCDFCLSNAPEIVKKRSHPELWKLGISSPETYLPLFTTEKSSVSESLFYFQKLYEELILKKETASRSSSPSKKQTHNATENATNLTKEIPQSTRKKPPSFLVSWNVVISLFNIFLLFFFFQQMGLHSTSQKEMRDLLAQQKQIVPIENELPVGTILAFYGTKEQVPKGFLLCDGERIKKSEYPKLVAHLAQVHPALIMYQSSAGEQIAKLPDFRGVFLRGLDLKKGYDPDRKLGSYQEDHFAQHRHPMKNPFSQNHTHLDFTQNPSYFASPEKEISSQTPLDEFALMGHIHRVPLDKSSSKSPTYAEPSPQEQETRPKNIAVSYMIKY